MALITVKNVIYNNFHRRFCRGPQFHFILGTQRIGLHPLSTANTTYGSKGGEWEGEWIRKDIVKVKDKLRGVHFVDQNRNSNVFTPHPFNRRFAFSKRPLFPIEPRNLRVYGLLRKKRRGVGLKSNSRGIRKKNEKNRGRRANSRTFEGGQTPLYRRLPKFNEAILARFDKKYDVLNLCKLRKFIELGRLDTRFPITQRHLHDSKCVKVKNGVHLFNVNDYPFPYKIDIVVSSCDAGSVEAIKRVGGSVSIIHYDRIALRAHLKPYKFEILPKTARPDIKRVYELEKFRLMGCNVQYIKPLWLIKEETILANSTTTTNSTNNSSTNSTTTSTTTSTTSSNNMDKE